MTNDGFAALAAYIEQELDFATSHYNDSYLERRFSSRMRRTEANTYEEYRQLLQSDSSEQSALLNALSINVTGFFRNPEVWEGIRSILRELTENHFRVNIWSAACSDGREPYSIAMLAHDDPKINESRISILATDINNEALEKARNGTYENSRTTDIDEQTEFLNHPFDHITKTEERFEVQGQIKSDVRFEQHDLINDEPKSGFNLVLCRNLFIYIDSEYKIPVLRTVAQSLEQDGYLIIGKAETVPPELESDFMAVDNRLRIYQRQ